MGLFRDMLNEARNTSVPTEYRIALGQLKRMYNKGEVPSEKELQKDAEMIAKKNHIEEDKFFEFVKSQFKINEAKSKEDLVKYYEKNLKNVEKEYSTDSRKQEYIDYAKGQLAAVKKDGNVGLIKFLKDWNMNEAKITKSDSGEFTLKDGIIQITKKELSKIHKDYKSDKTLLTMINGRTVSVPFTIINESLKVGDTVELDEAAVGQKGRTSYKEAMDYCEENEELVDEFRKIIKKLGGKTVAKALLDKLSQKPEIKDEIEHIEDIIDNSNY